MTCPLCQKDRTVKNYAIALDGSFKNTRGTSRKCAFESQEFSSENWNCVTMNQLRNAAVWSNRDDDSSGSIGVAQIPGNALEAQGYLVMTWYKERGSCGTAVVAHDDERPINLTLTQANEILDLLSKRTEVVK